MKHLIETEALSGLTRVDYDRIILDSSTDNVIVRGGFSNGHPYVDLGLSVKWATMNVGATSETDYGPYFAWGETTGYTMSQIGTDKQFELSDYKYWTNGNFTKYNASDGKTVLDPGDDAARANMGGDWRMPTKDEIQELIDNTTNKWFTNYNGSGVNGRKFTSKINGNSIFIPAAGYSFGNSVNSIDGFGEVWSSSLDALDSEHTWRLTFHSGICRVDSGPRDGGYSVRGVL